MERGVILDELAMGSNSLYGNRSRGLPAGRPRRPSHYRPVGGTSQAIREVGPL